MSASKTGVISISHPRRDDDFTWTRDACQSCGQVDLCPYKGVVTFHDYVGDLDTYAKQDLALRRDAEALALAGVLDGERG